MGSPSNTEGQRRPNRTGIGAKNGRAHPMPSIDQQPTLHADVESYFEAASPNEVDKLETVDKDHGSLHLLRYALHGGS
jgi:hypothetical protein